MLQLLLQQPLTYDCGIAKTKGDWPQRICSLREVCGFAECQAGSPVLDGFLDEGGDVCVQAMRELSRSFSKLAQRTAAPAARGKTSGCMRKKFAIIRDAVGYFIGADVFRAMLDLGERLP